MTSSRSSAHRWTEHWLATTELERAHQAVRDLQTRMFRAAQIDTVGELAGSIAHEVNQPLAAVVANAYACLRWLSAAPPNVPRAVEAAERIVKDGKDAGEIVRRVRALFKRSALEKVKLDLSEVIGEVAFWSRFRAFWSRLDTRPSPSTPRKRFSCPARFRS